MTIARVPTEGTVRLLGKLDEQSQDTAYKGEDQLFQCFLRSL